MQFANSFFRDQGKNAGTQNQQGSDPVHQDQDTAPQASEEPIIEPWDMPAPRGSKTHPSITTRDGFYFLLDEFVLSKEPRPEDAISVYLEEVEKTFENRWTLYPNTILKRTTQQKLDHGYDLDFRDNEIKRIRTIAPVDRDVYDYIDVFVDVIMLENMRLYDALRWKHFEELISKVHTILLLGSSVSIIAYALTLVVLQDARESSALILMPLAFGLLAIVVFVPIFLNRCRWFWKHIITEKLQAVRDKYEYAVKDAAGLAALRLHNKGRAIDALMHALKNRLETISSPDQERVESAPKLIRLLLWCPERMYLIENYYRAKIDQFNVASARMSLNTGAQSSVVRLFGEKRWIGSVAFAVVAAFGGGALRGSSGEATLDYSMYFPYLAGFMSAMLMLLMSYWVLRDFANSGESLVPKEALHREETLVSAGAKTSLLCMFIGSTFGAAIGWLLVDGLLSLLSKQVLKSEMLTAVVGLVFAFLVFCTFEACRGHFAKKLFEVNHYEYSPNVLSVVIKKMEASQWTTYSDLRVDIRVAEVFKAIFTAWQKESSKGLLQPHRTQFDSFGQSIEAEAQ